MSVDARDFVSLGAADASARVRLAGPDHTTCSCQP